MTGFPTMGMSIFVVSLGLLDDADAGIATLLDDADADTLGGSTTTALLDGAGTTALLDDANAGTCL